MKTIYRYKIFTPALAMAFLLSLPAAANGLNNNPWGFSPQNRASIAALIKQVEETPTAQSGYGYGGVTTMICGGDSSSAAKGNASCILLNNSTGTIEIGQDSEGNQTATSDITETTNNTETTIASETSLADALSDLGKN